MVVGAESESYRTLRHLVRRLPVMIAPAWLKIATQPIAIDDVIAYLLAAPDVPGSAGREVQIGGPDILSYGQMLDRMAIAMGMRPRPKIPVPFITPWLSALWLGPGHPGRHERRPPARGGPDHRDGCDRPVGRAGVRDRAHVLRQGARARARGGGTCAGRARAGMSGALVLFTRDLRVNDHPALAAAVREHEHVLPAFVLDEKLLATSAGAPNRLSFLLDCLRDLGESLTARGAALTVRRGDVATQAIELVRELGLSAIHMSRDTGPYARARLEQLTAMCAGERIELRLFGGITAVPPGAITPSGGDHYRVFTPYWRVWSGLPRMAPEAAPARIRMPRAVPASTPLPPRAAGASAHLAGGGEQAGRALLDRWLQGPVHDYGSGRDALAEEHTSRLSAHLHFGCVSAGEILSRLPVGRRRRELRPPDLLARLPPPGAGGPPGHGTPGLPATR